MPELCLSSVRPVALTVSRERRLKTGHGKDPSSFRLVLSVSRGTQRRLIRTCRTNLRRPHRLGHAEEHDHALAATAGREGFRRARKTAIDVLPVVHHPHIPGRRDREVSLHLQATADVTTRRRNLITRL